MGNVKESVVEECKIRRLGNNIYDDFYALPSRLITMVNQALCIHTYIIGHYNPLVRIIDLVSHMSCHVMLCVLILDINGGTYSLKSTPNDRFFETLFMAILFDSQSFCQKSYLLLT